MPLPPELSALFEAARLARERAYAPYSGYAVGAAVETEEGRIYSGCNVENAAFPQSLCAERVAVAKAVSEGHRRVRRLLVLTEDGGTPCGGCRSVVAEFGSPETEIIVVNVEGHWRQYRLEELLPVAFEMSFVGRPSEPSRGRS